MNIRVARRLVNHRKIAPIARPRLGSFIYAGDPQRLFLPPAMADMSLHKEIHGAFRRDLTRFIDAMSRLETGDVRRGNELATAWANFDDQLEHHHTGEHEIAWPALTAVGVSPGLLAAMDDEHESMAAAVVDV
ncbi:hemerythrin domain-containing protein, partial [Lacticaseibacillus rhamnosus]